MDDKAIETPTIVLTERKENLHKNLVFFTSGDKGYFVLKIVK